MVVGLVWVLGFGEGAVYQTAERGQAGESHVISWNGWVHHCCSISGVAVAAPFLL